MVQQDYRLFGPYPKPFASWTDFVLEPLIARSIVPAKNHSRGYIPSAHENSWLAYNPTLVAQGNPLLPLRGQALNGNSQ